MENASYTSHVISIFFEFNEIDKHGRQFIKFIISAH